MKETPKQEEDTTNLLRRKSGVIIRQHVKNPVTPPLEVILGFHIVLDDEPSYADYNNQIIKTLQ